jgi:NAD(P)-dependent dehydrogenase (short-subunit alcohol dehydrogenase family)
MTTTLAGKVAFVTGAAGGIGRATALAFARAGASVVVADWAEEANEKTAGLIQQAGGRAIAVRCDVTRAEDGQAALQTAVDEFGRLDAAFNNAGIEQQTKRAAAEIPEEEWDRIIAVNLRGVFSCLKYEIPLMLEQGGGAIVTPPPARASKASATASPTPPPSSASSASASPQHLTTPPPTSGSTPSAQASSTQR